MNKINDEQYINKILSFWFNGKYNKINHDLWFKNGHQYDDYIKTEFKDILHLAETFRLLHWYNTKKGFLAHTILLDQFSRHIYRHTKDAYKNDAYALNYVNLYLFKYLDNLKPTEALFALMPYQHSENIIEQKRGLRLWELLISKNNKNNTKNKSDMKVYEEALYHQNQHLKIIQEFKRFPKRNKYLQRKSTIKELEYIRNSDPSLPY